MNNRGKNTVWSLILIGVVLSTFVLIPVIVYFSLKVTEIPEELLGYKPPSMRQRVLEIFDFRLYRPVKEYDWSTFVENPKLSEAYSEALNHQLRTNVTMSEQEKFWGSDKRAFLLDQDFFRRIEALQFMNVREVRLQKVRNIRRQLRTHTKFQVFKKDGTFQAVTCCGFSDDHYRFAMIVVFNDDGSLTIKTNGEEMQYNYASQKEDLTKAFLQEMYWMFRRLYDPSPAGKEYAARQKEIKNQEDLKEQADNERSWHDPSYTVEEKHYLPELEKPVMPKMPDLSEKPAPKPIFNFDVNVDKNRTQTLAVNLNVKNAAHQTISIWAKDSQGYYRDKPETCSTIAFQDDSHTNFLVKNVPDTGLTLDVYFVSVKECSDQVRPNKSPVMSLPVTLK